MQRRSYREAQVLAFYRALADAWGPQNWWPARTRFEVIVGAYLIQHTAWTNVELALKNLRRARALTVSAIRRLPAADLQRLIRPAGYFRQKAERLKLFLKFLDDQYGGSLDRLFAQPTTSLRTALLALKGIGPETADSILLYAGSHRVFVVDTYTRRIADRHGILPAHAKYEDIRGLFERALSWESTANLHRSGANAADRNTNAGRKAGSGVRGAAHRPSPVSLKARDPVAQVFNEMHALLVGVGKRYCLKAEAHCQGCPLEQFLPRKNTEGTERSKNRD